MSELLATRRTLTVWWFGAALLLVSALVIALVAGHGAPSEVPEGIADPGLLTGWGLPVTRLAVDVLGILTVGALVTAVFLLPSSGTEVQGLATEAVRLASRLAWGWAAASAMLCVLMISDTFATPVGSLSYPLISSYLSDTSGGQASVVQVLLAIALAIGCRWVLGVRGLALLLLLGVATLAPPALTGHAAGSGAHNLAVVSVLLHLVGAALWVGGLAGLGWVAVRGSRRLAAAVGRFSTLAVWCIAVVAISGVVNATVRVERLGQLFSTSYGVLLLVKLAAVVVLAGFGLWHRRRSIPLLERATADPADGGDPRLARRVFARIAAVELLVMGATIAVAVALGRTPTPVPDNLYTDPIEELIGTTVPGAPTVWSFLTGYSPNGLGLLIVGLGLALYAHGVVVMRRRGDHWPVGRTISWVLGLAIVGWATFGGLGLYSHVLFSAHMVSHMLLSMVAPIFLVLAAPVTLALRTLPGPRQKGEVSPRQMLLSVLHSRVVRLFTHPVVAAALFVGSLYVLYFSSLFEALMRNHLGHALMELHFLAVGSLFYYVLVGIDPSPRTLSPFVRFGILLVTVPFHAFFAVTVMASSTVLGGSYWAQLDRPYQQDLLADQYLGGGIAWGMGEVPLLLVIGALFVQWFKSDRRESRRNDRQNDDELDDYNAYLAQLGRNSADS